MITEIFTFLFSVPEYELISPQRLNEDGSFLSHNLRTRRSVDVDHDDAVHYQVAGLGQTFHLRFERNTKLISPKMQILSRTENGAR